MKPKKIKGNDILKLDLNCIYPVTDILKAAGAGRGSIDKLKQQGLDVRWLAGRQWAKAFDVWELMRPADSKYRKSDERS